MRVIFALIVTFLFINIYAQTESCETLVWSDEFDYEGAPLPAKWGYDLGGGGWGNQELQIYTSIRDNSWVEDGKLFIKAIKTNGVWTSARLVTKQKGDWLYGRIVIRAKIPGGRGMWPALWMLPTDWAYGNWPRSGEIDIMEHVGYDRNRIHGTVHTEAYNHGIGTQLGNNILISTAYTEFHDYAVEWDEDKILFYVDDKLYFTFNNSRKTYKEWPFDKRFHLIMNIAVGGSWGGAQGIDPLLSEAVMEVDYVRVYELKPKKPVISGPGLVAMGQEITFSVPDIERYQFNWHFPDGVTISEGQSSNLVNVIWNDKPGTVFVEMVSECDTLVSDFFNVRITADATTFKIDNIIQNEISWKVIPTQSNIVSLEKEADEVIKVTFDVKSPLNNPYIEHSFDEPFNLAGFSRMVIRIKASEGTSPSNIRIDLVDENGNVEQENLFKIDNPNKSGNYETYSHIFGKGSNTFDLHAVKKVRLYFNYGLFGKIAQGTFAFYPIEMKNASTRASILPMTKLKVYPNPASDFLVVENISGHSVRIIDMDGSVVFSKLDAGTQEIIDLSGLRNGLYLLENSGKAGRSTSVFIKK